MNASQTPDGIEINTLAMIHMAHRGLALAERLSATDPETAADILSAADTLVSAAALVLRWPKAMIPRSAGSAFSKLIDYLKEYDDDKTHG